MLKRRLAKTTPEQQKRQDAIRELGCIACIMDNAPVFCGDPTIHHQTTSGRTISQDATVCLGRWHHQGVCLDHFTTSKMLGLFGPSLAKEPRRFVSCYGSNAELLAIQNAYLEDGKL